MAWLLLIGAGILEIGWPLGFKLASTYEKYFYLFITVSIISMGTSGFLLLPRTKNNSNRYGIRHLDGYWSSRNRSYRYLFLS